MGVLKKYAFLVKHKSYSSASQRALLSSDDFSTTIIGVSGLEEAIKVTNELLKQGIQLVELCGGFTEAEKDCLKQEINSSLPVGVVKLDKEDIQLLESQSLN
ncbi:DUF6506 family protein [Fulvivirga ulvae]|uniref:DUF6506 family protein n=1 Tax=Fulvivirga ulvae TaxID=2904245 RepID=UPI001F407EF5|nr:DUF6506 family protein [Fulvivirga ulvae]UII30475.1 DUF6506 family protein [Fulvivirga ulvae]